jgi:serine/threonine protein kinase
MPRPVGRAVLHHPNVITVYDFGTDAELGLDFLVMELLHGEDLANRMAPSGPPLLSTRLTASRGRPAAGHRSGLIHGDVKPGNLSLEEDDGFDEARIRVVDFGIACVAEGQDTTNRITRFDRGAPGQPRRRGSARRWRSAADFIDSRPQSGRTIGAGGGHPPCAGVPESAAAQTEPAPRRY